MNRWVELARGLFFASAAILVVVLAFVVVRHPELNPPPKLPAANSENEQHEAGSWSYFYGSTIDSSDDYPLVCLRYGYKVLKRNAQSVTVGWKYEVINHSSVDYQVTLDYKLTDVDGFILGQTTKVEHVRSERPAQLQDTINLAADDIDRLTGATWSISISPAHKPAGEVLEDRFVRAGRVAKIRGPYWLGRYAHYLANRGGIPKQNQKWSGVLAEFEVEKNERLALLIEKVELGQRGVILPRDQIVGSDSFKKLDPVERMTLQLWLDSLEEFGSYNRNTGGFNFER